MEYVDTWHNVEGSAIPDVARCPRGGPCGLISRDRAEAVVADVPTVVDNPEVASASEGV